MAKETEIQESWYNVETTEGISHVHSSEEMTELLADAAIEKKTVIEQISTIETSDDERPLVFKYDTIISPVHESTEQHISEQQQGVVNNIISWYCIRSLITSLLNPAVILSHLAVFSLGIYVGRRIVP